MALVRLAAFGCERRQLKDLKRHQQTDSSFHAVAVQAVCSEDEHEDVWMLVIELLLSLLKPLQANCGWQLSCLHIDQTVCNHMEAAPKFSLISKIQS